MKSNVYRIGKLIFEVDCYDDLSVEKVLPFSLFQSDEDAQIIYSFYRGIPEVDDKAILIYSDEHNRVYKTNSHIYRYMGHFYGLKDRTNYRCCIAYLLQNKSNFDVFLPKDMMGIDERKLFNCLGLEQVLAYQENIILHSSYISYKDYGIVFSAPSGTGKSTQADLWKGYLENVEIINGDRSVIGVEDKHIKVYGIPFCGSSNISLNKSMPLKCIVILRQGTENVFIPLSKGEAFKYLFNETSIPLWNKKAIFKVIEVLSQIITSIPVYFYYCLNDRSAVDVLLQKIEGGKFYGSNY